MKYDLGKMFGLKAKPYAQRDIKDFVGPGVGVDYMNKDIAWVQEKFPNAYYVLSSDLGWSDADILNRTFFTLCYLEVSFIWRKGGSSGVFEAYGAYEIGIPGGQWWVNTELRSHNGVNRGLVPFDGVQDGGSALNLVKTHWKSLYGAQNDGVYAVATSISYPGENGDSYPSVVCPINYSPQSRWVNLAFNGTNGAIGFNDPTQREAGLSLHSPGENSLVDNCIFSQFNDFGILMSGAPAPGRTRDCSFFHNHVAGYGLRGCAAAMGANMELSFSGDFNPYAVFMFRQGEAMNSPNKLVHKTVTTASFVQPSVGATVVITVADASGIYLDRYLAVEGGGTYTVTNIAGTSITIRNEGYDGAATVGATVVVDNVYKPFWPYYSDDPPGGSVTTLVGKYEPHCYGFLPGLVPSGTPGQWGKGQMLARLMGVFTYKALGGTCWSHFGKSDAFIEVVPDIVQPTYDANSSISINGPKVINYAHWLHVWADDIKWINNLGGDQQHGDQFTWHGTLNSRNGYVWLGAAAGSTAATYRGRQPFIGSAQVFVWNHNAAPTFNFDTVTGYLYP